MRRSKATRAPLSSCLSSAELSDEIGSGTLGRFLGSVAIDAAAPDSLPVRQSLIEATRNGIHEVRLVRSEPIVLDESEAMLDFVRFLRDCRSTGIWVDWQGDVLSERFEVAVRHLAPPTNGGALADRWRRTHAVSMCTLRRGGDFTAILDTRTPNLRFERHVITGDPWLKALTALSAVTHITPDDSAIDETILRVFESKRLVVRTGDSLVAVPSRPVAGLASRYIVDQRRPGRPA